MFPNQGSPRLTISSVKAEAIKLVRKFEASVVSRKTVLIIRGEIPHCWCPSRKG
ncbi:hypothetical protein RHECNPAF_3500099 [Rhizobium etli CNPAF512]|nr:hypothetical protein RHECNPAF_3500099 [Rhizobium etli CNPAF512]